MELLSTDAYNDLFKSEVTRVLDNCAQLRTKIRRQGAHDRVPLSEEACTAKRAVGWRDVSVDPHHRWIDSSSMRQDLSSVI